MKISQTEKAFLISTGIGLIPIALSYGLIPDISLKYLYNMTVEDTNSKHIFRAMTGLYFAMIGMWFIGAFQEKYRLVALYAMAIFMLGLAFGRIVSFVFDGIPHWLLIFYAVAEIFSGLVAINFIYKRNKTV
jgi:hypothetical protein